MGKGHVGNAKRGVERMEVICVNTPEGSNTIHHATAFPGT
jgi:hypothetical protein